MDIKVEFRDQPGLQQQAGTKMIDFRTARLNMVESQVRPNGITDSRIIAAMDHLPREDFVPEKRRDLAYCDEDLPLLSARPGMPQRYLMEPMSLARLIQTAEIGQGDSVLVVGAATGYGAAIAAQLAQKVTALEENQELAAAARRNLEGIGRVDVVEGPLKAGHRPRGPYDVIIVEGCIPEIPETLAAQLKDGGRLVAVVGDNKVARITCLTRSGAATSVKRGFGATVGQLPGFAQEKTEFVF
jgi:protein-L-isoaspartate(D-aspartate) O-methyltransferase